MNEHSVALVSVVIPARNATSVLPQQLEALAAQDHRGDWEVVVADNGSTDGTADLVLRRAGTFPVPLRVVEAARAAGINVGRNVGAEHAAGDVLLFCDADDIVSPAWVRSLSGVLGEFDLAGGPIDLVQLNSEWARQVRPIGAPYANQGLLFPIGANMGCRASVWRALGGFDEEFDHGGWDETDFCYRAQVLGYTVGEAPDALVHYRLRDDLRGFARQQMGIGRGERLFRHKHPEFLPALSPGTQLSNYLRSVGGLARRAVRRTHDRDLAVGLVAYQTGRIYEGALLHLPRRSRTPS